MRRLLTILILLVSFSASAQTDIYDTATLRTRINTDVISNGGTYQLTPLKLNKIFNGFLNTFPKNAGGSLVGNTIFNGHNLYNFVLDSMHAVQINTQAFQLNLG